MELGDLHPHLGAKLRVQIGQGLIHEIGLGLPHNGGADGHTLLLSAGECRRLAVQKRLDLQHFRGLPNPAVDFRLGKSPDAKAEGHIVIDRHMGIQGIALKHHAEIALLRLQLRHILAVNEDLSLADGFQPRQHTEGSGFAAAGGPHDHHQLPILNLQIEIGNRCRPARIYLGNML